MANRAQIRAAIRDLVNDTAGTPLWTDSALNAAIVDAVARYGAWRPVPSSEPLVIAAGTTAYALPAAVAPDRPIELYTADMQRVPLAPPDRSQPAPNRNAGAELAYWIAGASLYLTRDPAGTAGTWSIIYGAPRSCPINDIDPVPIELGDEPIVYQLAAAQLVERRALDDAKHGPATASARAQMRELADFHRKQAAQLMGSYRRRARGGSTQS